MASTKTGTGTHEWWLDQEHTHVATRMGNGDWIPFLVEKDGSRQDTGAGPFKTLHETQLWWARKSK